MNTRCNGWAMKRTSALSADKTPSKRPEFDSLFGSAMLSQKSWEALGLAAKLSPRELQIVRGIFDNQTEEAIASSLGISRHTIHTYLARLFRKLNATTRTQVVLRVVQQYLYLSASCEEGFSPICDQANACSYVRSCRKR